jgi:hypothetical protein
MRFGRIYQNGGRTYAVIFDREMNRLTETPAHLRRRFDRETGLALLNWFV